MTTQEAARRRVGLILALALLAATVVVLSLGWCTQPRADAERGPDAAAATRTEGAFHSAIEPVAAPTTAHEANRAELTSSPDAHTPPPDAQDRDWLVRGAVRGAAHGTERGLAGAHVRIAHGIDVASTTTDDQGRYEVRMARRVPETGAEDLDFRIHASCRGFGANAVEAARGEPSTGLVEVAAIELEPGTTIRGRALCRADGKPCTKAMVTLHASGETAGGGFGMSFTDAAGVFEVGTTEPVGAHLQVRVQGLTCGSATSAPFKIQGDGARIDVGDLFLYGEAEVGIAFSSTEPGVSFAGLEAFAYADFENDGNDEGTARQGASMVITTTDETGYFLARGLGPSTGYIIQVERLRQTDSMRLPEVAPRTDLSITLPVVRIDIELPPDLADEERPYLAWTWLAPDGSETRVHPSRFLENDDGTWSLVELGSRWRVDASRDGAVVASVTGAAETSATWTLRPVSRRR
jgi:hypothetical protein